MKEISDLAHIYSLLWTGGQSKRVIAPFGVFKPKCSLLNWIFCFWLIDIRFYHAEISFTRRFLISGKPAQMHVTHFTSFYVYVAAYICLIWMHTRCVCVRYASMRKEKLKAWEKVWGDLLFQNLNPGNFKCCLWMHLTGTIAKLLFKISLPNIVWS